MLLDIIKGQVSIFRECSLSVPYNFNNVGEGEVPYKFLYNLDIKIKFN
jgi:hypothetical protein